MEPICRICMSSSAALVNIFVSGIDVFPSLEHMINECVEVKVKRNDQHSKQICRTCVSDLHSAYRLKRNYELTVKQFNKIEDENVLVNVTDVSDQENSPIDDINAVSTSKRKRKHAFKLKLNVMSVTKKLKTEKSELKQSVVKKSELKQSKVEKSSSEERKREDKHETNEETDKSTCASEVVTESEPIDLPESVSSYASEETTAAKRPKNKGKKNALKLHPCNYCDKVFEKKPVWRVHMRIHTGERPFKCPHCAKDFADRSNHRRHLVLHAEGRWKSHGKGYKKKGKK